MGNTSKHVKYKMQLFLNMHKYTKCNTYHFKITI